MPIEAVLEASAGIGEGACMVPIEAAYDAIGACRPGLGAGGNAAGMLKAGPSALGEGAGAAASARGIVPFEILSERSGAGAVNAGIACVVPGEAAPGLPGAGAGATTGARGILASGEMAGYPSAGAGAGAGIASKVVIRFVSSFAGTLPSLHAERRISLCRWQALLQHPLLSFM